MEENFGPKRATSIQIPDVSIVRGDQKWVESAKSDCVVLIIEMTHLEEGEVRL